MDMACRSISNHITDAFDTNQCLNYLSDGGNDPNEQSISHTHQVSSRHGHKQTDYSIPDSWGHLSELAPILPVENPNESSLYRHRTLEGYRRSERVYEQDHRGLRSQDPSRDHIATGEPNNQRDSGKSETCLCLPSSCVIM